MNKVTVTIKTFDKFAQAYEEKFSAYVPYTQTYEKLSKLIDDSDSGYQNSESEDRVYTYFYDEMFLAGLLSKQGFEIVTLERKAYPQEGRADTLALFFYARVVQ